MSMGSIPNIKKSWVRIPILNSHVFKFHLQTLLLFQFNFSNIVIGSKPISKRMHGFDSQFLQHFMGSIPILKQFFMSKHILKVTITTFTGSIPAF